MRNTSIAQCQTGMGGTMRVPLINSDRMGLMRTTCKKKRWVFLTTVNRVLQNTPFLIVFLISPPLSHTLCVSPPTVLVIILSRGHTGRLSQLVDILPVSLSVF